MLVASEAVRTNFEKGNSTSGSKNSLLHQEVIPCCEDDGLEFHQCSSVECQS